MPFYQGSPWNARQLSSGEQVSTLTRKDSRKRLATISIPSRCVLSFNTLIIITRYSPF